MILQTTAYWHRDSFEALLEQSLPTLLARRTPLIGYHWKYSDENTVKVQLILGRENLEIPLNFQIPAPDSEGVFRINDKQYVVVPEASSEHLQDAKIRCVGDMLLDYIDSHLGDISPEMMTSASEIKNWIPIDFWVQEFLSTKGQSLDNTNWTARITHLRRIRIPEIKEVVTSDQFGRVCPFETPEGPNIGHIFSIALGAGIHNSRLVIEDKAPSKQLGLTASMVPFIEHNDSARQLMGVNMMRQWIIPQNPEPAWVQSGNEPLVPDFWCGYNLLTAYVSCGPDTFEDGIIISQSCAERMHYDIPIEPGDKFSNRHGTKGVVSRIVPDNEMPHLPDGTPVELCFSFIAMHTRLNLGQVREALMGRIAVAKGEPIVIPPFEAPTPEIIQDQLREVGLPEDGMVSLTLGKNGRKFEHRSMVGWVYWGRTVHIAEHKIQVFTEGKHAQRQGVMENRMLRDLGCFENIAEALNLRSCDREDSQNLQEQLKSGSVEQLEPPTPLFQEIVHRLNAAGIRVKFGHDACCFSFGDPTGDILKLSEPIPHPWLPDYTISAVGVFSQNTEYPHLVEVNTRFSRIIQTEAPESLRSMARNELEQAVAKYFSALLTPEHMRLGSSVLFSGRTVLAPGIDLQIDQIGLANEIAWKLFEPLVIRKLHNNEQVQTRSEQAGKILDEIMAQSWVILNRTPTWIPTALMAFRPVRIPDKVIRIHPLNCFLMNSDFDGDQVAVFLPVTEHAQREAAEKLSIRGHLKRDPNMYDLRLINQEALWGLAWHGLTPNGLNEIESLAGIKMETESGLITRSSIAKTLRNLMERDGMESLLDALQKLWKLGLEIAKTSGASISPFAGSVLPNAEKMNKDILQDSLERWDDFKNDDLGPQILAVKSGARGNFDQLQQLVGNSERVVEPFGVPVSIQHSLIQGRTQSESFALVPGMRRSLERLARETSAAGYGVQTTGPRGFGVFVRAMRSRNPGVVFARAAAIGEKDPLTDLDSRLLIGLKIE